MQQLSKSSVYLLHKPKYAGKEGEQFWNLSFGEKQLLPSALQSILGAAVQRWSLEFGQLC